MMRPLNSLALASAALCVGTSPRASEAAPVVHRIDADRDPPEENFRPPAPPKTGKYTPHIGAKQRAKGQRWLAQQKAKESRP